MKLQGILILVMVFISCNRGQNANVGEGSGNGELRKFKVKEVVQTRSYTYFRVREKLKQSWVAVEKTSEANVGDTYYYKNALEMKQFHSKELDRTFEVIYFINEISESPFFTSPGGPMPNHSGKIETEENTGISIQKENDELTISSLYENSAKYSNKQIEIRGIVVKVNEGILDKNWIHIQDGSKHGNNYDLTVTTTDLPVVNDEVVFKGTISLNRDFGSGYKYDLIMEDATLQNKGAKL